MASKPSFKEAFFFWLKLGFISFGGPAGQIAVMHQYLVEKRKWISESRFLHALNYCMLLPGPEAQQLAIYSGWLLHGWRGGIVAGLFFILPSIFILLALSILYVVFGNIPWFQSVFAGLKPAVVGIVLFALYKIGSKSLRTILQVAVALLSFAAIFFFNIPFPLIIVSALVLALIAVYRFPFLLKKSEKAERKEQEDESGYYINSLEGKSKQGFRPAVFIGKCAVAVILWLIPFGLYRLFTTDHAFWDSMSLFFSKAALVTFGGAYAVLPYVAQLSVEKLHWLNASQMMDGLALGETTPGPLIMVLAFVGFMGAYSNYGGSLTLGALGLFITVYYTFLPCFFYVLAGAPLVERSRTQGKLKEALPILSAAVAGVMLNLAVYLGKSIVWVSEKNTSFHIDYFNAAWILLSLVALSRFKVNMILWIGISAVAGLIRFYLI